MAWERRKNGKRYFYLSVWKNGRVEKEYFGRAELGVLAAHSMQLLKLRKEDQRQMKQRMQAADDAVRKLDIATDLILHATMLSRGFQRSDRHPWRRPAHDT